MYERENKKNREQREWRLKMITFNLLNKNAKIYLPPYKNDVGFDVACPEYNYFSPHETKLIDLGFSIQTNMEYFAFILPRSSISKKGLLIHIGTIDPGYEGEIKCCITNLSNYPHIFEKSEKICQLVFLKPVNKENIIQIKDVNKQISYFLPENYKPRLNSGFGSSGK